MVMLMEQTLIVLSRANEGLLCDVARDEFFLRTAEGKDSTCHVADLPMYHHIIRAPLPAGALDGLKRRDIRLEADLCLMPTPIEDVPPGEPPYFAMLLMIADSGSGAVVGMEMLSTVDGLDAAFARIPEALTEILIKAKSVPATIAGRHPILVSALEAYTKAYGIEFECTELLPAVDEATDSLMEFMHRRA